MGWANCGEDSNGRPIGYAHPATCDHPGCRAKIDRGLSFKCGPMHGNNAGLTCEGYFCEKHRTMVDLKPGTFAHGELGEYAHICAECEARMEAAGDILDEREADA